MVQGTAPRSNLKPYVCSSTVIVVEPWELEQLRRSIAMLPPGHSAGAVSKAQSEELLVEVERSHGDLARYRHAVDELRRVLSVLECDPGPRDQAG
jgi:hypothetical protein